MPNLDHFIQAQNINWIKRILENRSTLPYHYISTFIGMPFEIFLKCNLHQDCLPNKLPKFDRDILLAWFSLKQEPSTVSDVQREVLWNNKFITINNKIVFNKALFNQGLIFINDIIDKNGRCIPYQTLINTFGNSINSLDYICLKDAIPLKWRLLIKHQITLDMRPNEETIFFTYNKKMQTNTTYKIKVDILDT